MASGWVGLPQVRGIAVSEYVALRLPLPGVVVTWFVTGFRISVRSESGGAESPSTISPWSPNGRTGQRDRSGSLQAHRRSTSDRPADHRCRQESSENQVRLGRWGSVTFPVQNPGSAAVHSTVSGFRATSLAILTSSACASSLEHREETQVTVQRITARTTNRVAPLSGRLVQDQDCRLAEPTTPVHGSAHHGDVSRPGTCCTSP